MLNQELEFAKTLEAIQLLAKEQGNVVSASQVEEYFTAIGMEADKLELVYDYLKKKKIGIGEPVNLDDYLSEEDVDYLEHYLEELMEIVPLNPGEREAITLSSMAGDIASKKRLVELSLKDIVEIAKLYTSQGVCMEDLIGEGNVALVLGVEMIGCCETVDEAQGMLAKMAMDAMEAYINETVEEVKVDLKVVKKVNQVADEAKELAEVLHRKITVDELARESKLSEKEIREAILMSGNKIEYFEETEE